jgi:hypothetical protein
MVRPSFLLLLPLAAALALASPASAAISIGQSFAGEATYYGAGNDNRGACGGNGKPTGPGGITTVAINSQQWCVSSILDPPHPLFFLPPPPLPAHSRAPSLSKTRTHSITLREGGNNCGICIEGRGTGVGAGGNPVGKFFAAVNNLCPECKYGDVDFAMNGDGRWKVEWKRVDCASKTGRRLLQANADTAAFLDMLKGNSSSSSSSSAAASSPSSSGVQAVVGALAPAASKVVESVPVATVDRVKGAAASVAGPLLSKGSRKMMASTSSYDFSSSSVAELASSPSSAGFESVLGAFAPAAQILAPTVQRVADSLSEETVSKVRDAASSVAESVSKSLNSRKLMDAAE